MPRSKLAWSCWNYLTTSVPGDGEKKGKANVDRVTMLSSFFFSLLAWYFFLEDFTYEKPDT